MTRPVILEVCSGEGGSTRGLMDAGWDVIAVDNNRNRLARNPARWKFCGDAFDALDVMAGRVDGLWAGWPCQGYSAGTRALRSTGGTSKHKRLIAAGREAMQATGLPYVIENVEGAKKELINPLLLCGRQFDLTATDDDGTPLVMDRHRLFESNVFLMAPPHAPPDATQHVAGSYGGARRDKHEARHVRKGGYVPSAAVQARLLNIDWMSETGLRLSIPPVFAQYIGAAFLDAVCPSARRPR